jgi:hypothetical protein
MNILDENIPDSQWRKLQGLRFNAKKIGKDISRKGKSDEDIIPLLHELNRPTFFTLDIDFYKRRLRHDGYCLVYLDIEDYMAAEYIRRILRHPALNTKAKRMGAVIRAKPEAISLLRIRHESEERLSWEP